MIKGTGIFSYVGTNFGVTQEGEKYIALNVLSKDNVKTKFSFMVTQVEVVDKIVSRKFVDFQDIKLLFDVKRVFNKETRYSHWEVDIIGVE